ncbi:hypothetical protein M9980_02425 [Sphingomonas donggukensis]|uniref:Uncharacterized protein n=1 Tax=Sphingomonas donggukensis TaxID=2949093 RepID=A0ABY4TX68_9SPHN|nr:hypothetical protein [Sphingomonas donggukensis]URW76107.1 hypothetical protein M9980_02425 [Sphingomonas donggukensis]
MFLNHLVVEAGHRRGAASPRVERNTANALARLRWRLGEAGNDTSRLRALGRSRACLFYCDGVVRRADLRGGAAMTLGWGSAATVPLGTVLSVDARAIADICAFYDRVGDDVIRLALAPTQHAEGPPSRIGTAAPGARPRVAAC